MRRPQSGSPAPSSPSSAPSRPPQNSLSLVDDEDDAPLPKPKRKRRRRAFRLRAPSGTGIIVTIMLLAGGYGLYWILVANTLQNKIDSWIAEQKTQGVTVSYRSARVGGFPGMIRATLKSVTAQADVDHGGWSWSTGAMAVAINPLMPFAIALEADQAPHVIQIPTASRTVTLAASADTARLHIEAGSHGVEGAELTLKNARLEGDDMNGDGYTLTSFTAVYAATGLYQPEASDTTHTLTADLEALTVPAAARLPLGRTLTTGHLDLRVLGGLYLNQPLDKALQEWRKADGMMLVDDLKLIWSPLSLDAAGRVTLDEGLQPQATLNTRMSGFLPAIQTLETKHLMRSSHATMAKVLLASLARKDADGTPVLDAPMIIRGTKLSVGPVILLELPRMPWGPPEGGLGAAGIRPGFSIDRDGAIIPK